MPPPTTIRERAFAFWCASKFYRMAPDKDQSNTLKVFEYLLFRTSGTLNARVSEALKEMKNDKSTRIEE